MRYILTTISITLTVLILLVIPRTMSEETAYIPEPGDEVVIYSIKYKEESFEEGKTLQAKGFGKAIEESGQTRLTYFLEDEEKHTIIAVSFFKKGHETQEWHTHPKRQEVLDKLKPLWREPVSFQTFKLVESHASVN